MGILRTREEYLPVTCAIIKPEDRDAFFSAIKKQPNGRPDSIARLCEVTTDMVNDWISGKSNVPYHSLQTLAHQYQVAMPPVGELRREYQSISQAPARREAPTFGPPPKRTKSEAKEPRREPEPRRGKAKAAKPPRERQQQPRRQEKRPPQPQAQPQRHEPRAKQQPRPKAQKAPPQPKGPRVPEPSEHLAYWVGITILTGRREGTDLIMSADRNIGQNFAGTWANLTRELLGVKPSLQMLDNGKVQEARMPAAGFEDFLNRLDLKEGKAFNEAGVPRWAWSNPAWKAACLKGIVDARAHFQRAPAIALDGVPERLARAVQKMLLAFKLDAVVAENGTITLKGVEAVDQYFEKVGTGNMKLRDQYRAYKFPRGGRPPREVSPTAPASTDAPQTPAAPDEGEEAGEEEKGRVLAEEVEAADEEAEVHEEALQEALGSEPGADDNIEAAIDAAAAAKAAASAQPSRFGEPPPQPKKEPPSRRRRTMFRGRPRR